MREMVIFELMRIRSVVMFNLRVLVMVEEMVSSGYNFSNCIKVGLLFYMLFNIRVWFLFMLLIFIWIWLIV